MRTAYPLVVLGLLLTTSCGTHVPQPRGLMPGTPHVSWIIMTGGREDPDRDFVCQSEPRNDCVVPASKPNQPVFSNVHLYYHGAGAETKYAGAIHLGFFEGAADAHVIHPNLTVKKNGQIANSSVSGMVSSKPGTYPVMFDLTAEVVETERRQPIHTEVPVVVR